MGTLSRISSVVAIAFAATVPFIACSDSNSTSAFGENSQAYSEPALESSSSLAPESSIESSSDFSESYTDGDQSSYDAKELKRSCSKTGGYSIVSYGNGNREYFCDGLVLGMGGWLGINGSSYAVYAYADGAWSEKLCDAENEGEVANFHYYPYHQERNLYFKCTDNGWKQVGDDFDKVFGCQSKISKDCTTENAWTKEKITCGNDKISRKQYYACLDGEWKKLYSEVEYYCTTEKTTVGDTCSFESSEGMEYYMYMGDGFWEGCAYDPKLGYCPNYANPDNGAPRISESDGQFYYCVDHRWRPTSIVPRQYTDSWKNGLTDEEYDILDLPKDAKVGDRVGGLLEWCKYDVGLTVEGPDVWHSEHYDFCTSQNYYRYRENGTWTIETEEERENDSRFKCECTEDNLGAVCEVPPQPGELGMTLQCMKSKVCDAKLMPVDMECSQGGEPAIPPGTAKNLITGYTLDRSEKSCTTTMGCF